MVLRKLTRLMSNSYKRPVVVVDTTSDLGGFGAVPHMALGNATRMKVQTREDLHKEMIRTAQNIHPHSDSKLDVFRTRNKDTACARSISRLHSRVVVVVGSLPECSATRSESRVDKGKRAKAKGQTDKEQKGQGTRSQSKS